MSRIELLSIHTYMHCFATTHHCFDAVGWAVEGLIADMNMLQQVFFLGIQPNSSDMYRFVS